MKKAAGENKNIKNRKSSFLNVWIEKASRFPETYYVSDSNFKF